MVTSSRPIPKLANILRDREYPDSYLGLPFRTDMPPLARGPVKEPNDEDHISSSGAIARAIFRDTSDGSYANQQKQQSSACRHSTDGGQSAAGHGRVRPWPVVCIPTTPQNLNRACSAP